MKNVFLFIILGLLFSCKEKSNCVYCNTKFDSMEGFDFNRDNCNVKGNSDMYCSRKCASTVCRQQVKSQDDLDADPNTFIVGVWEYEDNISRCIFKFNKGKFEQIVFIEDEDDKIHNAGDYYVKGDKLTLSYDGDKYVDTHDIIYLSDDELVIFFTTTNRRVKFKRVK